MVILKPISPGSVAAFKAMRLAALRDTPLAFGSTYAKESLLSDADWDRRVAQWQGDRSACYLAWDGEEPCGIAAGFLDKDDARKAHLVSMWVAPSHRRRGIGRLLVNAVMDWARSHQAVTLRLAVTSCNDAAMCFYEQLGFTRTGTIEPYPNDPALVEFEMICSLGHAGRTAGPLGAEAEWAHQRPPVWGGISIGVFGCTVVTFALSLGDKSAGAGVPFATLGTSLAGIVTGLVALRLRERNLGLAKAGVVLNAVWLFSCGAFLAIAYMIFGDMRGSDFH
jgi:ribosomal protein S18 acetylase RimI-like enzyme